MDFRVLPEYLIENVTEYLDFLSRYNPNALETADKDILITFAITFLSPGYINNPFLKAKLVSVCTGGYDCTDYMPDSGQWALSNGTLSKGDALRPTCGAFAFYPKSNANHHSIFHWYDVSLISCAWPDTELQMSKRLVATLNSGVSALTGL